MCTLCSLSSESEELLSQISTAQFTHLSVTSDLSQLAVTTHMNHVLLVNLSDYFEVVYVHEKHVHSTLAKQENSERIERNPPINMHVHVHLCALAVSL